MLSYVTVNIDKNERLHKVKSTDNSRLILALTAIGKDVTDADNHNLLNGLGDMEYIRKQGINGPIYALLALDSGNYPVPENGDVSREALIRTILDAQLPDGGWALSGNDAQPDMTAMALQALARYYGIDSEVAFAVEDGLTVLSEIQNDDGGYSGDDGATSESVSQVIVALTALGIDPDKDERFIKDENSVLDALIQYYVNGGGFKHILSGKRDGMATEQAYYALTAYYRMLNGRNSLYDMTDVIDMGGYVVTEETTEVTELATEPAEIQEEGSSGIWLWVIILLVCAAGVVVVVVIVNRKRIFGKYL